MTTGDRTDPLLTFNFLVEIESVIVGGFSEVTGLQLETKVEDYREGGVNHYVHKLPGATQFPSNLVLKRGLTRGDTLWRWHQEVVRGSFKRKNLSVVVLDSQGAEQWRFNFAGAYPIKWTGPDLKASTAEVAVETLELVHRGFVRAA